MPEAPANFHATCIAVEGRGALIVGPSGAGKSDLALRTAMTAFHIAGRPVVAALVADDQVLLEQSGDRLLARPPPPLADLIEVRGLGIVAMPTLPVAEVHLIVDVTPGQPISRLPDPLESMELLGMTLPLLRLSAFEASSPAKLVLALLQQ